MMELNEEEALKIILGTPVNEAPIAAQVRAEESNAEKEGADNTKSLPEKSANTELVEDSKPDPQTNASAGEGDQSVGVENEDEGGASALGNSIGRQGWSSSFEEPEAGASQEEGKKDPRLLSAFLSLC